MNEGRLCGYCRQPGHMMRKCPTVLEERNNILKHTPQQRLVAIQSLAKLGLGIGAMIQRRDWYESEHVGVINSFEWLKHAGFHEVKNIKYSKRVRVIPLRVTDDYGYRRLNLQYVAMGNGKAEFKNAGVHISRNLAALEGRVRDGYDDDFIIVSPSYVIEFDPEILVENVQMPRRLCFSGELENGGFMRGIMPSIPTELTA